MFITIYSTYKVLRQAINKLGKCNNIKNTYFNPRI